MNGIIFGAFDLLHPGHLYTLDYCKKRCDNLIVGLHVNPKLERKEKNKPVETVFERLARLKSCKFVDGIIPYETEEDLLNILATADIQVRFNGEDHQAKRRPSKRDLMCRKMNIGIIYVPRKHSWSTTELRARIK